MMLLRQMVSITRLSIRRLVFTRFMFIILLLAVLPILLLVVIGISMNLHHVSTRDIAEIHNMQERILRECYIRFIIFFVASISGFAIVRQDLDDRTLHYLLLAPVRRWSVVISKFIGFWIVTAIVLTASYWAAYAVSMLIVVGPAATVRDLFGENPRYVSILRETGVMLLAMTTYGTIGMAFGSVLKSLVFAPILWTWEMVLPWLPLTLKKLNLSYYFHSLLPVPQTGKTYALEIVSQPASTLTSLLVLGCMILIAIGLAVLVFWWRECAYVEETA